MKIQIRQNVFETNSSSVHSFIYFNPLEFEDWKKDLLILDYYEDKLYNLAELKEKFKESYKEDNSLTVFPEMTKITFMRLFAHWLCYENLFSYNEMLDRYICTATEIEKEDLKEKVIKFEYKGFN